jgi:hypothetical protein
MVTVKLPGGGLMEGSDYLGEEFRPAEVADGFFEAVREDRVAPFILNHPEIVNADR